MLEIGATDMASMPARLTIGVTLVAAMTSCGAQTQAEDPVLTSSTTTISSSSFPAFRDVASLAVASDAVVVGTIGEQGASFVDDGGVTAAPGVDAGIPMSTYVLNVDEVVSGPVSSKQITIGWLDSDVVTDDELSRLAPGQKVVVFLDRVQRTEAPGLPQDLPELWIPMAGDNGVFDLAANSQVTPRSTVIRALQPPAIAAEVSGKSSPSRPVFSLRDLVATVRP